MNSLTQNGYFVDTKLINANKIELIVKKRFKNATIELTTDTRHAGTVKLLIRSKYSSLLSRNNSWGAFVVAIILSIVLRSLLGFILSIIIFVLYRYFKSTPAQVVKEDQFNIDTFQIVANHLRYTIEQGGTVNEKCWNCFELRDFRSEQCSHCGAN